MCGKNFIGEDGCRLGDLAFTAQEFMENFSWLREDDERGPAVSFRDMWGTECGSDDCADYNSIGGWTVAPLFEPGLLGKWLVVGALDRNGRIARFSNGCGEARNWCLFAPGEGLRVGPNEALTGTSLRGADGERGAGGAQEPAPGHADGGGAGGAALLSGPAGEPREQPERAGRRLRLGAVEPGDGRWPCRGRSRCPSPWPERRRPRRSVTSGVTLSPALAQVGERLQGVRVAVAGVGNAYYNTRLSDAVAIEAGRVRALGHAAGDMFGRAGGRRLEAGLDTHRVFAETGLGAGELHAVGMDFSADGLGRWRLRHDLCDGCGRSAWREWSTVGSAGAAAAAPFFAYAGRAVSMQMQGRGLRPFAAVSGGRTPGRAPWRQFGLRWRHERDGFLSVAEVSRVEEPAVSGARASARWGAPGPGRSRTGCSCRLRWAAAGAGSPPTSTATERFR